MILILGSNGLLGSEFLKFYQNNPSFVFWSRSDFNFLQKNLLLNKIKKLNPHVIINCCAYTNVDASESNKKLCYDTNTELPIYLSKICARYNIFLIHFSSDYIFNGRYKNSYKENHFPDPINYYGKCKLMAEEGIKLSSSNYCIFRTSWLFSLNNPNNFVVKIIRQLNLKDEISVVCDQFGSPTSTDFLICVVDKSLKNLNLINKKTINVSLKGKTSWYLFSKEILSIFNQIDKSYLNKKIIPIKSYKLKNIAKRPKNSYLNCDLLKKILQSINRISWKIELARLILKSNYAKN